MVLEYADFGSVASVLENYNGDLLSSLMLSWICDLARGAAHLHKMFVKHKDLKAENMLLFKGGLKVKICDFGLSRQSSSQFQADSKGVSQIGAGTNVFMAPEAFRQKFTPKSDVYSIGMTIIQIITGKRPVVGDSEGQVRTALKVLTANIKEKSIHTTSNIKEALGLFKRILEPLFFSAVAELPENWPSAQLLADRIDYVLKTHFSGSAQELRNTNSNYPDSKGIRDIESDLPEETLGQEDARCGSRGGSRRVSIRLANTGSSSSRRRSFLSGVTTNGSVSTSPGVMTEEDHRCIKVMTDFFINNVNVTPSNAESYALECYQKLVHNPSRLAGKLEIDKGWMVSNLTGVDEEDQERTIKELRKLNLLHIGGAELKGARVVVERQGVDLAKGAIQDFRQRKAIHLHTLLLDDGTVMEKDLDKLDVFIERKGTDGGGGIVLIIEDTDGVIVPHRDTSSSSFFDPAAAVSSVKAFPRAVSAAVATLKDAGEAIRVKVVKLKDSGPVSSPIDVAGKLLFTALQQSSNSSGGGGGATNLAEFKSLVLKHVGSEALNWANPAFHGMSLLEYACHSGNSVAIKLLLTQPVVDVNKSSLDGNTPLIQASLNNHLECIKLLLNVQL